MGSRNFITNIITSLPRADVIVTLSHATSG